MVRLQKLRFPVNPINRMSNLWLLRLLRAVSENYTCPYPINNHKAALSNVKKQTINLF